MQDALPAFVLDLRQNSVCGMPLLTNSATNCRTSTRVRSLRTLTFGSPYMLSLQNGLSPFYTGALIRLFQCNRPDNRRYLVSHD
jgi:hypothetical protein